MPADKKPSAARPPFGAAGHGSVWELKDVVGRRAVKGVSTPSAAIRAAALTCVVVGLLIGAGTAFAAGGPPSVEDETASNVAATSASLNATINPEGSATTYRFEYGETASYSASAPIAEGSIAAGATAVNVEVHIQGLSSSTVYHYRVVATNGEGSESGADATFTTEATGGPLQLLDGRQWELVTPPNKHGSLIESGRQEEGMIQAAANGTGIVYYASAPVTGQEAGSRSPEQTSVLSRRGATGWSTDDLSIPHGEGNGLVIHRGAEYKAFSTNLSRGLVEPYDFLKLTSETTEWTPYLRDNLTGSLQPVLTASNVLPGTEFGKIGYNGKAYWGASELEGANSSLTHLVLRSEVPLTANATGYGLYEWYEGALRLISILPGAEETPASGGYNSLYVGDNVNGAGRDIHDVSADGSRIVFAGEDAETKELHLYLRDVALKQTVQVDGGGLTGRAHFWAANTDDSEVFFTDESVLTPGATANNLYQCEVTVVAGTLTCELTDLSPGTSVEGVIGVSEDGSYVYFVESAATGKIYLAHEGSTTEVATIGQLTSAGATYFNVPNQDTLRVSPNGRYLAFMSSLSLTGYDNRDAVSGKSDTEVYLYDAISKELTCASCSPTGVRPHGLEITDAFGSPTQAINDRATYVNHTWLSGSVPAWDTNEGVARHQPRYLSDSGRLFFNSPEALVPQDVNGLEDVYEYEPDGVGSCATSGGCVDLVSSGSSQEETIFMDASESGDDAFFITATPLVLNDADTAADMYDAHVCSAEVPCVSEAVAPPPCESSDGCKGAPSSQPTVFGAPSSATFSGAENLVPRKARHKGGKQGTGSNHRRKSRAKRARLRHALKRCAALHRHSRQKRRRCKRMARKRLGGAHSAAAHHVNGKASRRGSGR